MAPLWFACLSFRSAVSGIFLAVDRRDVRRISIEISSPDSKLLLMCSIKPHLHADGAVPGGRLLVVVCVVEGDEVKKDFAAMSGLAALGGFVMRQWMN
jgi:hypothetical protein